MNLDRIPTEAEEQAAFIEWAELYRQKYPELAMLYHVPNGGSRHKLEAVNLKRQGVKKGVPDLCLPVARRGYHSLYIEMKRSKGGRLTQEQKGWIQNLRNYGNLAIVCEGAELAKKAILMYLRGD